MKLSDFLQKLSQLNRANVPGKGLAPHKPILLLALADWFELHTPTEPLLPFEEDLVRLFQEEWNLLAPSNYPCKSDLISYRAPGQPEGICPAAVHADDEREGTKPKAQKSTTD